MTISDGQNIIDIALQVYGGIDAAQLVELCYANGFSLDVVLTGGQEVVIPTVALNGTQAQIAQYFSDRQRRINTGEKPLLDLAYRVTDEADRVIDDEQLRLIN